MSNRFTERAQRVILIAQEEAKRLNHDYVGTEHILLGLIALGEGVAAQVLANLGVDVVREEVLNLLGEGQSQQQGGGGKEAAGSGSGSGSPSRTKSKTPTLDEFGRDLTIMAREGKLDPVIGRADEIERMIQILARRTKNNPVLIGDPGVGKTAIVEGLAQKIASGDIPEILASKRVLTLDLALVVAGTKYRGEFEQRLKNIIEEIRRSKNSVILFIDELHTVIGAGAAEGAIDASNMIKPALSRGELQCIGATTLDEYRKYIERDAALERRFQPIIVDPPSVEETFTILQGLKDKYEAHHKIKYDDSALR